MEYKLKNLSRLISSKSDQPPGSLVYVGEKRDPRTIQFQQLIYEGDSVKEINGRAVSEISVSKKGVHWINVLGVHNPEFYRELGQVFGINPLIVEDILNTKHPPKIEEYEDCVFAVLRLTHLLNGELETYQINVLLKDHYILTLQTTDLDQLQSVRSRIHTHQDRAKVTPDVVFHSIVDFIVDAYILVAEKMNDRIDELEEEVLERADSEFADMILTIRRELNGLRKIVRPLREPLRLMVVEEKAYITDENYDYFRDLYGHVNGVMDRIENHFEHLANVYQTHIAVMTSKTNDAIKTLTVFASIFIPLTFLSGVYGMNFKYMPELDWKLGYAGFWLICLIAVFFMSVYFKRKNWW